MKQKVAESEEDVNMEALNLDSSDNEAAYKPNDEVSKGSTPKRSKKRIRKVESSDDNEPMVNGDGESTIQ